MADKKKFQFNPQTLSYEQIEYSLGYKFKRIFWYLLSSMFGGAIFFILFFMFLSSPREKEMYQVQNRINAQYNLLSKQVDEMQRVMTDLQQRDDNLYRSIFQAEPIPISIRLGLGGKSAYYDELAQKTNSQLVVEVTRKIDLMEKQLYVQSKSFDDIVALAQNNEIRLECIPAIQPVLNKDLTRVASGYGFRIDPVYHTRRFHQGMDFTAPTGTDVYATGNATVLFADWRQGYGNTVVLDHGFGYQTLYAHLHRSFVRVGQKVKRGDVIALVGNTGKSTGPHLHYEVRYKEKPVDPRNYYFQDLSPEEYDKMIQLSNNFGLMLD